MKWTLFSTLLVLTIIFSCESNDLQRIVNVSDYNQEIYFIDSDSVRQDRYVELTVDGKDTISQAFYKNGKLNGERKIYGTNGKLTTIENYQDGEYHGPELTFYPNGKVNTKGNFTNGILDSMFYVYYETGVLKEKVSMRNNVENGPFEEYYETGELHWEGSFIDGPNEVGLLLEYDLGGQIIKKMNCGKYRGEYICQTIWEKEKGDIIAKLEYEN